ncbi:MAG: DNA repair protein RecO [Hyphomonadaceae bacterium]|nr:DNA repair protein RecO [Hyphomonadaceae bacterium]
MEWTDEAVVLGARPFGEGKALVEVFSREHGRTGGLTHSARRAGAAVQPGNLLRVGWRARTADQLGLLTQTELLRPFAASAMNDAGALAAIASTSALLRACAERQAYPGLFDAVLVLLDTLAEPELWPAVYTRFELGLLAALGYGLDLGVCALTGVSEDLAWVSPRSGRAASRAAGEPFADKLLALPSFLASPTAAVEAGDVADALALAGHFLEQRVFERRGEGLPPARRRLIEALGFSGRL